MNGTLWTKEREAKLRELHAQGLRPYQIALKLGVSRSACIGKLDRLSLKTAYKVIGRHSNREIGRAHV